MCGVLLSGAQRHGRNGSQLRVLHGDSLRHDKGRKSKKKQPLQRMECAKSALRHQEGCFAAHRHCCDITAC
jgi:hypothetical protein